MAVLGNIQIAYKDLAWFNTNPTKILKVGQHVYLSDGANDFESAYTIGDGLTQLQFLPWKGVEKGIPLSGTTTPITGPLEFDNNASEALFSISGTIRNIVSLSGTETVIGSVDLSASGYFAAVTVTPGSARIEAADGGTYVTKLTSDATGFVFESKNLSTAKTISIYSDVDNQRHFINAVNGLRGTVFIPTTTGDYIQKGYADTTYQPVGSYLSGTVGTNQIAVGGVSGLVGSAALTYNGTNLQYNKMGSAFDSNYLLGDFQYGGSGAYSFLAVQNKITTSSTGFIFGESNTRVALFTRQGTTAAGTFAGTSIAMADTVVFQNGSGYNSQIHSAGSIHTRQAGLTTGNYGDRLDTIGYRIDDIANIHTTNLNRFTVNGKSYLGGNFAASSTLDLASLSNAAQLRIIGNSSVALSSNGEIGYDLTHAYIRIGSTNYQLDQQVNNASVLSAIGYTPTQSVSGTTNRITSTGGATPVVDISTTFEALLGKVANPLSQFAATTSAQLAGVISDETGGAGVAVFNSNPTLLGATFTTNVLTVTDVNVVLGTTTGTKFGTATTQKLGFYNATPIVQVGATIDLGVVLSNLGLRAAGTAYTITTSGVVAISGASTFSSATNTIFNNQNVQVGTVGKGLVVKEGVNGRSGAATMVAGTITIANTTITANSRIFITPVGNTNAGKLDVTIVAATSFTIRSDSPTDTRVVNYFIVEGN